MDSPPPQTAMPPLSSSQDLSRTAPLAHRVAAVLFAGLAYFASARIGYALAIPHGIVTLWPPSGVMLGLLLLTERRHWWLLVLGALGGSVSSDLMSGYPLGRAIAAALANATESATAAFLLTRRLGPRPSLGRLRAVIDLTVIGAILSNAVTAWLGAAVLGFGFRMSVLNGWFAWWVGDGLGMLVVTPVVLTWTSFIRRRPPFEMRRLVEALILALALIDVAQIALGPPQGWPIQPIPYTVFPLLFWAALRFGPVGAATAAFVTAVIATANAASGHGPFIGGAATGNAAALQVYTFVTVAVLSSLIPAAVLRERQRASRRASETEDRMRFAMDVTGVGTWELDAGSGELLWSETQERLHGLAPGAFGGTVQAFLGLVHADDRAVVEKELARARGADTESDIVYRAVRPDGSVRWINRIGHAVHDAAGARTRWAGISVDVSERRMLEEQYRQSQKMEAIGQLAGGVAHDFNNLLTAILTTNSVIQDELEPDHPVQADLAEIQRAAERGASLTSRLLAFSRKQVIEPRVLDLGHAIRSLESLLRRTIGEDIDVAVRSATDLGCVRIDAGQLEQVILNLALNARDAMPRGGSLVLEARNVDLTDSHERAPVDAPRGRYVMLTVSDTGVGMDAATAARAFEPFFTTKPMGRGTGLGLSTVYGIVQQAGGRVVLSSEPGRGTTFKVYLPRVDEPAQPSTNAPRIASDSAYETILVVEDEDVVRGAVKRILEEQGYRVFVASSPDEALAVVETQRRAGGSGIDLLLTDVVLRETNGRALAEQLWRERPELRVLYMSGYTDDAIVRRGVLTHDAAFIHKPFSKDGLLEKVRAALRT